MQGFDRCVHVWDVEAEDGVLVRREVGHYGDTQGDSAGVEDSGEVVLVGQLQAQRVAIESHGASAVSGADDDCRLGGVEDSHGISILSRNLTTTFPFWVAANKDGRPRASAGCGRLASAKGRGRPLPYRDESADLGEFRPIVIADPPPSFSVSVDYKIVKAALRISAGARADYKRLKGSQKCANTRLLVSVADKGLRSKASTFENLANFPAPKSKNASRVLALLVTSRNYLIGRIHFWRSFVNGKAAEIFDGSKRVLSSSNKC